MKESLLGDCSFLFFLYFILFFPPHYYHLFFGYSFIPSYLNIRQKHVLYGSPFICSHLFVNSHAPAADSESGFPVFSETLLLLKAKRNDVGRMMGYIYILCVCARGECETRGWNEATVNE